MARANGRRTSRRGIYLKLRQIIPTLETPPGAALSENELAAALGVSRTPVRESLTVSLSGPEPQSPVTLELAVSS